jgi:hypothetical protein
MKKRAVYVFLAGLVAGDHFVFASGHGPVFGLATPTNPKGGFSADLTLMGGAGRGRNGSMLRGSLGYGVTENFKLSISAPVVIAESRRRFTRNSRGRPRAGKTFAA